MVLVGLLGFLKATLGLIYLLYEWVADQAIAGKGLGIPV